MKSGNQGTASEEGKGGYKLIACGRGGEEKNKGTLFVQASRWLKKARIRKKKNRSKPQSRENFQGRGKKGRRKGFVRVIAGRRSQ